MNRSGMYDSRKIANYFIFKGNQEGIPLTSMKLIKLVYISHGWYLGFNGKPLISDVVQAWKYGPVIPVLYRVLKRYGPNPIESLIDINNDFAITDDEYKVEDTVADFLDSIWNHYKSFSALELSTITHEHDTPWSLCYNRHMKHTVIPTKKIQQYYSARANA